FRSWSVSRRPPTDRSWSGCTAFRTLGTLSRKSATRSWSARLGKEFKSSIAPGFTGSLEELSKNYDIIGVWQIDTVRPMYVFKNCVIDGTLKYLIDRSSIRRAGADIHRALRFQSLQDFAGFRLSRISSALCRSGGARLRSSWAR